MTRELLFINSFPSQLTAFAGWKSLIATQSAPANTLAPSDYPSFEIIPGEATYTAYDSLGHPTNGVQAFVLRVFFTHSQLANTAMLSTHSAYISTIETFFAGGYIQPSPATGDVARIDSVQIVKIDPLTINKSATCTSITVHAEYLFTIF